MPGKLINAIRWNLSKKAGRFAKADVIAVSGPKSGRTWLRVFLYSYFSGLENREFTLKNEDFTSGQIPNLFFTHDLFEHVTEPRLFRRLRGRHLIPRRERRSKPIMLLVRDPRDVMVSWYFQLTKRSTRRKYEGSLSQMIYHPTFGIDVVVGIMNTWIEEWGERSNFKLVRYEDCRTDPENTFRGLLKFLGFDNINESVFAGSLEFSRFDNMKMLEASGKFETGILLPRDINDPDSFKVRRGIVGGYKEYLNLPERSAMEKAIARLDRRYGYNELPRD